MSACRSCKQPILWGKTVNGKAMPIDPEPVAGGNVELVDGRANVVTPEPDVARYVSHFTTCYAADNWRGGA